jgi:predicted ATP-grasp superfamily ATP-dependent carboligase
MTVLIAALSGRALAACANAAGTEVIVADLFGDVDTRALARWVRLPGDLESGIDGDRLGSMIAALPEPVAGIVAGSGFEAAPELLDELARHAPLLGNSAACVRAVKAPFALAALLDRLGLPCPRVAEHPIPRFGWLRKRIGGSGGAHIRPEAPPEPGFYYQERAFGRPVSALFVADGRAARVIGFSEQWSSPTATMPFRYGGCAAPAAIPPVVASELALASDSIAAATGLVGLNSLDALVDGDNFTILEINPRPGATLDVFDENGALWHAHLNGVAGRLPGRPWPTPKVARAAAIVYAESAVRVTCDLAEFPWVADIPARDTVIPAGAPVCTVLAEADDVAAALELAHRRGERVRRGLAAVPDLAVAARQEGG